MKGTILIIDDEELIIDGITEFIADLELEIIKATSGSYAIEILQSQKVDIVISDLNMPQTTGVEIIKRTRDCGLNIPFIFFTAYATPNLLKQIENYKNFEVVHKPDFNQLKKSITKAIDARI